MKNVRHQIPPIRCKSKLFIYGGVDNILRHVVKLSLITYTIDKHSTPFKNTSYHILQYVNSEK